MEDVGKKDFIRQPYVIRLRNFLRIAWMYVNTRTASNTCYILTGLTVISVLFFISIGYLNVKPPEHHFVNLAENTSTYLGSLPPAARHSYLHSNFWHHERSSWHSKPEWAIRVLQYSFNTTKWDSNDTVVLMEILVHNPDLICIQNLPRNLEAHLFHIFRRAGFDGIFHAFKGSATSLATFWKKQGFQNNEHVLVDLGTVGVPERFHSRLDDDDSASILLMQAIPSQAIFVLVNTAIRQNVNDATLFSQRFSALVGTLKLHGKRAEALIIAGEFNVGCDSKEYSYMLTEPLSLGPPSNDTETYLDSAYATIVGNELPCARKQIKNFRTIGMTVPEQPSSSQTENIDLILYTPGLLQPVTVLMYPQQHLQSPYRTWRSAVLAEFVLQKEDMLVLAKRRISHRRKKLRKNPFSDGVTAESILESPRPDERLKHIDKSEVLMSRLSRADAVFLCFEGSVAHGSTFEKLAQCSGKQQFLEMHYGSEINPEISRLKLLERLKPTRSTVQNCVSGSPLESVEGVANFVKSVFKMGLRIFIISDGLKELIQPVVRRIGVPMHNVFGNMLRFEQDGTYAYLHSDIEEFGSKQGLLTQVKERNGINSAVIICGRGEPAWAAEGMALSSTANDVFVMMDSISSGTSGIQAHLHVPSYDAILKALKLRRTHR